MAEASVLTADPVVTAGDPDSRRILLVSYFYGETGATGGFRWFSMARDLVQRGWTIDVITAAPKPTPLRGVTTCEVPISTWPQRWSRGMMEPLRRLRRRAQPSRIPDPVVPDDNELMRRIEALRPWRPGSGSTFRQNVAGTIDAAADLAASVAWSRRATRVGLELTTRHRYDAIVVSSPPHFTQLVGWQLSRRTGLPYVADYRDPWTIGVHEFAGDDPPLAEFVSAGIERLTQKRCCVAVYNTATAMERAQAQPLLPDVPRVAIPNGYDTPPGDALPDPERFRILYSGWIYHYMDPRVLLRAVRDLRQSDERARRHTLLELTGVPSEYQGIPLADMVRAYGLDDCTVISDRVSREEALRAQERAAVLVAFDYPHALAIVMKFYDYLRVRGELLLIGERGTALDAAARRIGTHTVPETDEAGILAVLQRGFTRWLKREYPAANDAAGVFHRSHRSAEFHELLVRLGRVPDLQLR